MSVAVRWISVFIDNPRERAAELEHFWTGVTGHAVTRRAGQHHEFAPLDPADGEPHLWFQTIDGPPAFHPDLYVEDVDAAAEETERLGAVVTGRQDGLVVLRSPGGLPFCLVRHGGQHRTPTPARWPGGASIVDQVCLDIAPELFEQEAAFWTDLTGWHRSSAGASEFDDLLPVMPSPMHALLQRTDDVGGGVRAHLDLSSDDRDDEVRRHLALGASLVRRTDGWTTLADPGGRVYCVTTRPAGRPKTPR